MPVPTSISSLDTNADNNSPPGTESAKGNIDNYLRAAFAFIKQNSNLIAGTTATLASSSSVAIGAAAVNNIIISGTTTITAFDSIADGAIRFVTFSGALTLTHNATSLILPGAANITTAANDSAIFKSLGSGNWQCLVYQRASGAVVGTTGTFSGAISGTTAAFSGSVTAATPSTGNRSTAVATTQMFSNEFVGSLGLNGYQKLANGWIIQWGRFTSTSVNGGYDAFSFPIRFPNACFVCTGNRGALGSNAVLLVDKAGGDPAGQLIAQNFAASGEIFNFIAIGY